jgi:hypothetical protein
MRTSAPAHRRPSLRRSTVLSVAVAGLAFAGCGGGGDELSKSELISKADAICKAVNTKGDALGDPKSFADLEQLGAKARDISDNGVQKLKELEAPKEIQNDWTRFVDMADQQTRYASDLVDAAKARDQQKIQSIATRAGANSNRLHALARRNGFKDCSQD